MKSGKDALVKTRFGQLQGSCEDGLFVFKGVPYAAAPVGERRWLPPQPGQSWQGVRPALAFAPAAPQNSRGTGRQLPGFEAVENQSEDCLFLNIWSPGLDDARRPVIVWIHGGGFTIGSGSQDLYRGNILALRGDVVVVSLSYRLGLLGFLNLNEVTGRKIPSTGNEGLLDQIAALEWVQKNISVFGGDPNNVTVFGESSGAMSIGCLQAMPASQSFFHKAILESGTGRMARTLQISVETSRQFLAFTGLKSDDSTGLRSLSIKKILAIQQELMATAPGGITPVAPVIDGVILPERPLNVVRSGSGMKTPVLAGNNLDEYKIAYARQPEMQKMDDATLVRLSRSIVPSDKVTQFIETYKNTRASRDEPVTPADIFSAIRTDAMFRVPVLQLVQAYCDVGQPAYNYLFTWKSPAFGGILGASHALEIGFVFGRPDPEFCGSGPEVQKLSGQMQDAWIAFARTGNPSCQSLGNWPIYSPGRKTMILGEKCFVANSVLEKERSIWDTIGEADPLV